jgi:hypothetical protein
MFWTRFRRKSAPDRKLRDAAAEGEAEAKAAAAADGVAVTRAINAPVTT